MMIATDIRDALARFLDTEVEAAEQDGRVALSTPAEYPDGDAVVVWLSDRGDGTFEASDLGEADARLITTGPGSRALAAPAAAIARRLDVSFAGGILSARARAADLPVAIWRVAQAAMAIAEAPTYQRQQAPKEAAFLDMVEAALRDRDIEVRQQAELEGASGHSYTATLFIPSQDAVVEPIAGEQGWNKAAAVYVEFGDLSRANGYKLLAVLDDRDQASGPDIEGLLQQVGAVTRWSRRDDWLETVTQRRLL